MRVSFPPPSSSRALLPPHGLAEWTRPPLPGLNAGQLPASFILLAFASRLELKVWPIVACGLLCVLATAAIVFGGGPVVVAGAGVLGFSAAGGLVLGVS